MYTCCNDFRQEAFQFLIFQIIVFQQYSFFSFNLFDRQLRIQSINEDNIFDPSVTARGRICVEDHDVVVSRHTRERHIDLPVREGWSAQDKTDLNIVSPAFPPNLLKSLALALIDGHSVSQANGELKPREALRWIRFVRWLKRHSAQRDLLVR